jgi:HPr kinase/phosphorylase
VIVSRPAPPDISETEILHASCVATAGRAVLILGPSGSGKSGLALQLMAFGAGLVADDRTCLWHHEGKVWADVPDQLRGMIEAREVGLLSSDPIGAHPVALCIDLGQPETDRLPELSTQDLLGCAIPRLRKSSLPHFPAAIMTYLRGNRVA